MPAYSEACERNKDPILSILTDAFKNIQHVLEIGSGTGQHAVYFARHLPHICWQPSDCEPYIHDIEQRIALEGPANCRTPLVLDVSQQPWPIETVDAVFSANTLHIMSWSCVEDFLAGVGKIIRSGGLLCIYGPIKYNGDYTSDSNAQFDIWLKQRDPLSGIRDFEAVDALAQAQGLKLLQDHKMPANNQLIIWNKYSG